MDPPPPGTLKINVHGTSSRTPSPNGFYNGIGAVYRNSERELKHLTIGVIPQLTPLGNQLWAIFAPLKRAFKLGYRDVILETDNLESYLVMKNFHIGAPAGVYDIATQINTRIKDARWFCMVSYIYPARNKPARFVSRLGKRVCSELFTLNKAVGGVEELLDWDLGFGIDDPSYQDILIPDGAPDPEDFDDGILLSDETEALGLGQTNTTRSASLDIEVDADEDIEEIMMEEAFQGGIAAVDGFVFTGDVIPVELA